MLGVQTGVMTLAGRPVAMAAQEDQLAVAWHVAMPAAEGDQALHYSGYSVSAQSELHTGALYLSGSSNLSWLGFSETGLLAAYDTKVGLKLGFLTHAVCRHGHRVSPCGTKMH